MINESMVSPGNIHLKLIKALKTEIYDFTHGILFFGESVDLTSTSLYGYKME